MIPNEEEMRKSNPEFFLLPQNIREIAIFFGNGAEAGWRRENVEEVIKAAAQSNLANLGGQLQFQTSDGVYEAYWVGFDSIERKAGEKWVDYVERASEEVLRQFKDIDSKTDYVSEAKSWPPLKSKIETGEWNPNHSLVFILYFEAEKNEERMH
jgi:hypothetical protein